MFHSLLCSLLIVAAKELSEYDDTKQAIIVPSIEALGQHNQAMAHLFIETLLPSNIALFEPGNPLYVVREKCFATMLQFYLEVRQKMGYSNVVVTKMYEAAMMVNLSDPKHPHLSPGRVLEEWSKVIEKDVTERRLASIVTADSNLPSMSSTLNQVVRMLGTLTADVRVLKTTNNHLATTCAAQESELIQARQEVLVSGELKKKLAIIKQKYRSLKGTICAAMSPSPATPSAMSPSPGTPSKRARIDEPETLGSKVGARRELLLLEDTAATDEVTQVDHGLHIEEIDEDEEEGMPESATELTAQSRAMTHAVASISSTNMNHRMTWNPIAASKAASAGQKGKKKSSANVGTKFPDILAELARTKKLNRSSLKDTSLERGTHHKTDICYCLELVQVVMTAEHAADLFGGDVAAIILVCQDIVTKMQMKIAEWDNYTWETAVKLQQANRYKLGVGVTGLASRIRDRKSLLIKRRGLIPCKDVNYQDQPLVEMDSIVDRREGSADHTPAVSTFFNPRRQKSTSSTDSTADSTMDSSTDSSVNESNIEMAGTFLNLDQNENQVAAAGIHPDDNAAFGQTILAKKRPNILESSSDNESDDNESNDNESNDNTDK